MKKSTVLFCNVESVLSDIGKKTYNLRQMHMRGKPQYAQYLAAWGITIANTANNHILEQGYDAAVNTACNLKKAGIKVIGAGKDCLFHQGPQLARCQPKDSKFAFLGLCTLNEKYAFNGGADLPQILDITQKLNRLGHIVIISVHWGKELMHQPTKEQRKIALQLANAGAKIVIGHHPHVIQGIEKINDCLIAYSLGNFIFNAISPDTNFSAILSVTIENDKISDYKIIPIESDRQHRPHLANGYRKEQLSKEIQHRNKLLDSSLSERTYDLKHKQLTLTAKRKLHRKLVASAFHTNPVFWPQIANRYIARKLQKW